MAVELENSYKPSVDEPFMNERQREYFKRKLLAWKEEILRGEPGEPWLPCRATTKILRI